MSRDEYVPRPASTGPVCAPSVPTARYRRHRRRSRQIGSGRGDSRPGSGAGVIVLVAILPGRAGTTFGHGTSLVIVTVRLHTLHAPDVRIECLQTGRPHRLPYFFPPSL